MHDDSPDDVLHQGLLERNPRALEILIRRYSREMSYFVRLVLDASGTAQDAEECANDLFVAAWQDIGSYDPARGSLRTWLTMRAKYIALDRRRQITRRQQVAMMSLEGGEYGGNREGIGWKHSGFEDRMSFQPPFGYYDAQLGELTK